MCPYIRNFEDFPNLKRHADREFNFKEGLFYAFFRFEANLGRFRPKKVLREQVLMTSRLFDGLTAVLRHQNLLA